MPLFSPGVERAVQVALDAHRGQVRKGDEPAPYSTHPIHVALILARAGAEDEVIQAGLLHDVVEDSADWTLERVEREFGVRVRSIVAELTEDKSRSWHDRKEQGIQDVACLSAEALLVKACDKLHNLSTLSAELARSRDPGRVWGRFRGGREETLRMSRRLVESLAARVQARLAGELLGALGEVEERAGRP